MAAPHWLPVRLSISPTPAHVRTARLVAVAVARQLGVTEGILDEIRLAVGEASARAVSAHEQAGLQTLVEIAFGVANGAFVVSVRDSVSAAEPGPDDTLKLLANSDDFTDGFADGVTENTSAVELAVVAQLANAVDIAPIPGGGSELTMSWPLTG